MYAASAGALCQLIGTEHMPVLAAAKYVSAYRCEFCPKIATLSPFLSPSANSAFPRRLTLSLTSFHVKRFPSKIIPVTSGLLLAMLRSRSPGSQRNHPPHRPRRRRREARSAVAARASRPDAARRSPYEKLLAMQMMVHLAATPERVHPMAEAQIARDETMAAAIARFLQSAPGRGLNHIVLRVPATWPTAWAPPSACGGGCRASSIASFCSRKAATWEISAQEKAVCAKSASRTSSSGLWLSGRSPITSTPKISLRGNRNPAGPVRVAPAERFKGLPVGRCADNYHGFSGFWCRKRRS